MQLERPFTISIAGLDPSAGAGLLADLKTFETLKIYGFGVVSALSVQDDEQVYQVSWLKSEEIIHQLEPLFKRFKIDACKIGIIRDMATLSELIHFLKLKNEHIKIVVDPVLKSSSGFDFYRTEDIIYWQEIIPEITLLTPNYSEMKLISSSDNLHETASQWAKEGNILIKGGHDPINQGVDYLFTQGNQHSIHPVAQEIFPKHGSGCVLSAAITAYLALGFSLLESCKSGKLYTEQFLNSNKSLLGYHSL